MMIMEHTSIEDLEILLNLSAKNTKNTLISLFNCETNGGGAFILFFLYNFSINVNNLI